MRYLLSIKMMVDPIIANNINIFSINGLVVQLLLGLVQILLYTLFILVRDACFPSNKSWSF